MFYKRFPYYSLTFKVPEPTSINCELGKPKFNGALLSGPVVNQKASSVKSEMVQSSSSSDEETPLIISKKKKR